MEGLSHLRDITINKSVKVNNLALLSLMRMAPLTVIQTVLMRMALLRCQERQDLGSLSNFD